MAKALGYDFDKVLLKKGIYSPKAQGDLEEDQRVIRENLARILSGKMAIPVTVKSYQPLDEALGRAKQQAAHNPVPTGADAPDPIAERVNSSSATPSAKTDEPTQGP